MSEQGPARPHGWTSPDGSPPRDTPPSAAPPTSVTEAGSVSLTKDGEQDRSEATGPGPPAAPQAPPGWSPTPAPPGYGPPQAAQGGEAPAPPGWGPPQAAQGWGVPQGWGPPQAAQGWGAPQGWGGPPAAPRPGVVPLRPLGLGELLDGSVSVVRRYPRPTLGLSAAVSVVTTLLGVGLLLLLPDKLFSAAGTSQALTDAQVGGTVVGSLGTVVVGGLAGIVLAGIITVVVGQAVLGEPLSTGEAWRALRPRLLRLVGLALLTGLVLAVAVGVGIGVAALSVVVAGGAGLVLGVPVALAGVAAAIYLYVRLSLAAPALVLEKIGIIEAFRRSGVLVRRSFWRVLGVLILAALIAGFVNQLLQLPFVVLGGGIGLFSGSRDVGVTALIAAQIGAGVAQTITAPFTSGVRALLYIDRRMRAEGLDVALAAAAATPR